jgi:hypothetical protein
MFPAAAQRQRSAHGFFLVRREAIDADKLHPRGFKILLEILIRFPELRVAEIPFNSAIATPQEQSLDARSHQLLSQLWSLRFGENAGRLIALRWLERPHRRELDGAGAGHRVAGNLLSLLLIPGYDRLHGVELLSDRMVGFPTFPLAASGAAFSLFSHE